MWGKGISYPLIGDKVFIDNPHEPPGEIWEVRHSYRSQWGMRYVIVPWPRGTIRCPLSLNQSRDIYESQLRPLDPLTKIMVALQDSDSED